MLWTVNFTKKTYKQFLGLPKTVQLKLRALVSEMQVGGPVRGNWKNYGKLGDGRHYCHLKSGQPTYVVCWEVVGIKMKIIEVYYVGTHEKAPY